MLGGFRPTSASYHPSDPTSSATNSDERVRSGGDNESVGSADESSSPRPILTFRQVEQTEQPAALSYISPVHARAGQLIDLPGFLHSQLGPELENFLSVRFLERRQPMRVWLTLTAEFVREDTQLGLQSIATPFQLDDFYFAEGTGIRPELSKAFSQLLERIALFTESGSGWTLQSLLRLQVNALYINDAFNTIGRATHFDLFDVNHSKHVTSDGKLFMGTAIFNLCDSSGMCFAISLGAGLHQNLPTSVSQSTVPEISVLRNELVNLAHNYFDFSSIDTFPCNFLGIRKFIKMNSSKGLISIVGFSRKTNQKGKKVSHAWPVHQTPMFLQRSLSENIPIIYLLVTSETPGNNQPDTYHVCLIRCFQIFMRAVKRQYRNVHYCPTCFAAVKGGNLEKHVKSCQKLGPAQTSTEVTFPPVGFQYRFKARLNALPQAIFGCMDLETLKKPVDNNELFGPLSDCLGKLEAVSYAAHLAYNLGDVPNLPKIQPKIIIGGNIMESFYQQMLFELCFLQTHLRRHQYRIKMTRAQKQAKHEVTHCSNCQRIFKNERDKMAHHNHAISGFNFQVIPVCSFIYSFIYSFTHSLTRSLSHSLPHLLTHSLTHSLIHSLTPSLTLSLTHSLPPSLTHSLPHSRRHP